MKSKLIFKILVGLPVLILADYLVMVILGCTSCLFGFGENYYCGVYCIIGKGILLLSVFLFVWYIFPELKKVLRRHSNAEGN